MGSHHPAMRDTTITDERPVLNRSIPATVYTDPARFEDELRDLFPHQWLLAARLDDLPTTGALARTVAGHPIVLTRDGEEVRAFHNVCSHRGSLVVADRAEGDRLRCLYHGWTYGLDGSLGTVPRQSRFEALDLASCGLPAVAAESWAGWVWVRLADGPPLTDWLGPWVAELDRYRMEHQQRWGERVDELELNWKAAVDAFNETYHVAFVHPTTVGRLVDGAASSFRYAGPHSRMVIPVRRREGAAEPPRGSAGAADVKDLLPEQRRDHCNYTIFPNVVFNLLATWGIVLHFEPVTVSRTRIRTTMLVDPSTSRRRLETYDAQWTEFCKVLDEDLVSLDLVGRGLRSPAFTQARFGGEEERLAHFHDAVDAALLRARSQPDAGR